MIASGLRTVSVSKGYLLGVVQVAFALLLIAGAAAGLEGVWVAFAASLGFSGILLFGLDWLKGYGTNSQNRHLRLVSKTKDEVEGIRRTALFDSELGVYQAWYFELRLREEIDRSRRYGEPVTVLVLKVLPEELSEDSVASWRVSAAQAAYMTARTVRTVDLTASLGPMEFGICLIHCDEDGAAAARVRLVSALSQYCCQIGYSVALRDGDDPKELISVARSRALGNVARARGAA